MARILIIDDESQIRSMLRLMLERIPGESCGSNHYGSYHAE
jgi:CheY-like chemotaxis protein